MRNISCSISFITLCYIVEIWITFGEVQMQQMPDLPYDPKSQTYVYGCMCSSCVRLGFLLEDSDYFWPSVYSIHCTVYIHTSIKSWVGKWRNKNKNNVFLNIVWVHQGHESLFCTGGAIYFALFTRIVEPPPTWPIWIRIWGIGVWNYKYTVHHLMFINPSTNYFIRIWGIGVCTVYCNYKYSTPFNVFKYQY